MFYSKKFKKFKNIKHCFFSRKGGFSKGIYHSLNCGKGSKDKKKNVFNLEDKFVFNIDSEVISSDKTNILDNNNNEFNGFYRFNNYRND